MVEINKNEVYTVDETAYFFKCSKKTIYKLIKNGDLKGLKLGSTKITGKSILEYINE